MIFDYRHTFYAVFLAFFPVGRYNNDAKQNRFLIKSGGGTGPMMPGNLLKKQGANSCGCFLPGDEVLKNALLNLQGVFILR